MTVPWGLVRAATLFVALASAMSVGALLLGGVL